MRVTPIYAGIVIAGFNPDRQPGDREGSWISHGLALVGASTKRAGFDIDLIDLRQLAGWDEFKTRIQANPADVYGISVTAVDYSAALQAVYEIKTTLPDAKIVVGGIHPTLFPEKYDYKVIDCVVTGEGEITFPQILLDYDLGIDLPRLAKGVKPDLSTLPWAARELFDYRRELSCNFAPDHQTPSVTMLAGRGCPYRCAYCQPAENAIFGHPHRMRPVDDVINELWWLYEKYRFKSVTFWDDTFTFNRQWIEKFCDAYDVPAPIAACSRADIICGNEPMIRRMAEVGVDWLVVGMETGSQRLLDFIAKGTTVQQNIQAAEICHKYGIKVFATIMYGLPTETREEADMTTKMLREINAEIMSPFWYVPIPGTNLHKYCERNDLILNDMETQTIVRTGIFRPQIKGVDYQHLTQIMHDHGMKGIGL